MKWINKYIEAERRAEACLPMQPKIIKKKFNMICMHDDEKKMWCNFCILLSLILIVLLASALPCLSVWQNILW